VPGTGKLDACEACGDALVMCKKFRIVGHVGRTVFRGVRTTDGHAVAIKIHVPPSDQDWTAWELFERSCRVLEHLHHPALPKVHAFERTDEGRLVLVREDFGGGTLEERMSERDDRLTPKEAADLLHKLLELLAYLQDRVPPVIHRDIKPSNIMFRDDQSWAPVLVDFDTIVSRRSGLTIVGTPGYAAPEQFAAESVPASDVYGVGTTMLFVATHTEPDELPRVEGRFDLGARLDPLDEDVRSVLLRMIEPDLSKRYATARAALDDLSPRREHHRGKKHKEKEPPKPEPAPEPAPSKAEATPAKAKKPPTGCLAATGIVVAGVVTLGGIGVYLGSRMEPPRSAPPAADPDPHGNAALEKECRGGQVSSCFEIGRRWDFGDNGLPVDYARAVAFYELGCTRDNGPSCNNLAVANVLGDGVPKDLARGAALYEKACKLKHALSCANLGSAYERGQGVPVDLKQALAYRNQACDLGNGEACSSVGVMYEDGKGTARDDRKAASYYGLSCDHDYAWGCRNYGIAFRDGQGVDKDDRRAAVLFKRACDGKEPDGCYLLGRMVEAGRGAEKDASRAANLFDGACKDQVARACDALAAMYARGEGVAKNATRAALLYDKACDGGFEASCNKP
jgi:TPR repeat protein